MKIKTRSLCFMLALSTVFGNFYSPMVMHVQAEETSDKVQEDKEKKSEKKSEDKQESFEQDVPETEESEKEESEKEALDEKSTEEESSACESAGSSRLDTEDNDRSNTEAKEEDIKKQIYNEEDVIASEQERKEEGNLEEKTNGINDTYGDENITVELSKGEHSEEESRENVCTQQAENGIESTVEGEISATDMVGRESDLLRFEMSEFSLTDEETWDEEMDPRWLLESKISVAGISANAPKAGQVNRYEFTGSEQSYTVPVSGYYSITCVGGKGHEGRKPDKFHGDIDKVEYGQGEYGAKLKGKVFLKKGTKLTIHVGGAGTHWGKGGAGWSDAENGDFQKSASYSGSSSGGGGGSSYVTVNGTKIISARGGDGGESWAKREHGFNDHALGGKGGGMDAINNETGVTWVDHIKESGDSVNGYIQLQIDELPPPPSLQLVTSHSDWTNKEVTLTAKVTGKGNGLIDAPYMWANSAQASGKWSKNAKYSITENGTYYCTVKDKMDSTGVSSIQVKNIDKLAPEGQLQLVDSKWTNGNVSVQVKANDAAADGKNGRSGLAEKPYCWVTGKSQVWTDQKTFQVDRNGKVKVKIKDRAGNETIREVEVNCVDKIAPDAELNVSETEWTNNAVKIEATAVDKAGNGSGASGLSATPFCWESGDKENWTTEDSYLAEHNGMVSVKVRDNAGNITVKETKIENMDMLTPELKLEADTGEWTNETVAILAIASDRPGDDLSGCSGLADKAYCFTRVDQKQEEQKTDLEGDQEESQEKDAEVNQEENRESDFSEESGEMIWGEENTYMVSANGRYLCQVRDRAGNVEIKEKIIDCIDDLAPEVQAITREENWYEGKVKLFIDAIDLQKDKSQGSGLATSAYSIDGKAYVDESHLFAEGEGSHMLKVRDKVGNVTTLEFQLSYDKKASKPSADKNDDKGNKEKNKDIENHKEEKTTNEKETLEKAEITSGNLKEESQETKTHRKKGGKEDNSKIESMVLYEVITQDEVEDVTKVVGNEETETKSRAGSHSGKNKGSEKLKKTGKESIANKKREKKESLVDTTATIEEITKDQDLSKMETMEQAQMDDKDDVENLMEEMQKVKPRGSMWEAIFGEGVTVKQAALYVLWVVAIIGGLVWMLFAFLTEHVVVYRRTEKGNYEKVGLSPIIRRKDYKQVNLTGIVENGKEKEYKIRFSRMFLMLHHKQKILLRTFRGIELRNIKKEIEIAGVNS